MPERHNSDVAADVALAALGTTQLNASRSADEETGICCSAWGGSHTHGDQERRHALALGLALSLVPEVRRRKKRDAQGDIGCNAGQDGSLR
jgi:hypothetical protein